MKTKKIAIEDAEEEIPENFTGVIEWSNGSKEWFQNGLLHRIDGAAMEYTDGTKYWCQNNLFHRLDGPAIEQWNGKKEYWILDIGSKIDKKTIWDISIYVGEHIIGTNR